MSERTTPDELLVETAERAFAATCTHAALQEAERDGWSSPVWDAAVAIGLPWVGVAESAGGAGGTLEDAVAVLRVAGFHGAPVPLAESGLLAGWLLAGAGLLVGDGPATVVPDPSGLTLQDGRLHGTAVRVPWARRADALVVLVDGQVAVVPTTALAITPVANLAGEPRDTVVLDGATPTALASSAVTADELRFRGALTRVALMAGALDAMAQLTDAYTRDRRQFGKPIASFQAVQAMVVQVAEEAVLVDVALQVATRAAAEGPARFEIGAAKLLAGAASRRATRAAHQAHGAIGMTQEYGLHHLSRRLWSWRAEFGDGAWATRLGRAVAAVGADELYRVVAEGSAACPEV